MSNSPKLTFPNLIYFEDYHGDFKVYFNAAYEIFHGHFISNKPSFEGLQVTAPRYPEMDGIHKTFYHITLVGEDEGNREPDFRRLERIRFPRFLIENHPHNELLIWEKEIGRDKRIHIMNEAEMYLLVLTRRSNYIMLWTAFMIEKKHTLIKKKKEYEAYIKTKTA